MHHGTNTSCTYKFVYAFSLILSVHLNFSAVEIR
jgi:hypothetical protein